MDRANPLACATQMVNPATISRLDIDSSDETARASLIAIIRDRLEHADAIILSHEFLFNKLRALEAIAQICAQEADEVRLIGYSRRQSSFLKSAYSQWHFRSVDHTFSMASVIKGHGLDPSLFSGLERFLIAVFKEDRYAKDQSIDRHILHWGPRYSQLRDRLSDTGVQMSVGFIPSKSHPFSLIDDFYYRVGLERPKLEFSSGEITNRQFDPHIVEAINMGVLHGIDMPNSHEKSDFLHETRLPPHEVAEDEADLMQALENHFDTAFWEENKEFCQEFHIDPAYFAPKETILRSKVDHVISQVYALRRDDPSLIINRKARLAALLAQHMFQNYGT